MSDHRNAISWDVMMSLPPTRRVALMGAGLALAAAPRPARAWAWLLGARLPDPRDPATTLEGVEAAVSRLLPLPEMTVPALAARMEGASPRPLVLFDVRTEAEFAAGHLPGAIRLDPGLSATAFAAAHGARITGADVVLYCAVGWRSGVLLERVRGRVAAGAPASMVNLRGGMFRWHAEGLALASSSSPAFVHPFDEAWETLLRRIVPRG